MKSSEDRSLFIISGYKYEMVHFNIGEKKILEGTVMQIEKALMIAYVFQKHPENFTFQFFIILQ